MKINTDNDPTIEQNIADIQALYPGQLVLSQRQFAQLRNKSVLTLSRERKRGIGAEFKDNNGTIEYPVRKVAEWLSFTVKTN